MKKVILLFCIVAISISCNKKEKKVETIEEEKTEVKRNMNDFLIFDNTLTSGDIENAEYNNIDFQKEGAVFTRDSNKPTYIKIPFSNLDFKQSFNASFTFNTTFDDGRNPQSLITFTYKYTTGSRAPLYIFTPGNKISGTYGEQLLWKEKYKKENGRSKMYFDSFKIKKDTDYFVSVNFDGKILDIYLNSELYASFNELTPHDLKSQNLIIGSMLRDEKSSAHFQGTIYGLKIFNQSLEESEIVTLFNSQPSFFEY